MRVLAVEYDCGFEDEITLPPRAQRLSAQERKQWNRLVQEYEKVIEIRHLFACSTCPPVA